MIQTYSPTIRRKEMEAVLTCMVDEKIGPGEMSAKLVQTVKEMTGSDGALALRSSAVALEYALDALDWKKEDPVMISALAPVWQFVTLERLGYKPMVLDVCEENGLVTPEIVSQGIKDGGRLFILTESMGILPDIKSFLALEVPVIEDISQSALAYYPYDESDPKPKKTETDSNGNPLSPKGRRSGMYGIFAIFGMEDKDIIASGGGAVLMAPSRREWTVLKNRFENAPSTDIMPDLNAALACVELKEFARNENTRRELFSIFSRALMTSSHKTYIRASDDGSSIYSFPVVLNAGFKDVKNYAQKKGVEVSQAYENSVIAYKQEELRESCICANSLLLRCALFPLYPRLGQKDVQKIIKILSTLP